MIFTEMKKKQRDNLRLFPHLWPLQTTIWADISQCLPGNPAENQILGILVILIVDCDIGGSPLGINVHNKYTLNNLHRILKEGYKNGNQR